MGYWSRRAASASPRHRSSHGPSSQGSHSGPYQGSCGGYYGESHCCCKRAHCDNGGIPLTRWCSGLASDSLSTCLSCLLFCVCMEGTEGTKVACRFPEICCEKYQWP